MSNGGMLQGFLPKDGQRMSAAEVERRRALAQTLSQQAAPRDYWSGVSSAIGNIGGALHNWQADQAETAGRSEYEGLLAQALESGATDIASLAPLLTHDFASSGGSALGQALLNQSISQSDPLYQARLGQAELGLEQAQNPFQASPATPEQLAPWGIAPQANESWTIGPDGLPQQVYAPAAATGDPFTLSPGQQRFDAMGNPIASVEAQPSDSSAEEKLSRITELGYSRDQAIQLSELYVLGQDENGRSVLLNRATGQVAEPVLLPGQAPPTGSVSVNDIPPTPGASEFPQVGSEPPNYSTIPEGTDIGSALGVGGTVSGGVNAIADYLFGNAPIEGQQQASNALQNLRLQTNQALLEGFAGRTNVYTQQMIDDLAVLPGMPPNAARDRFQQTKTLVDQQIARIENEILSSPSTWTPQDVRDARSSVASLRGLSDTYESVLQSVSDRQSRQDETRPPLDTFMRR